MRLIDADAMRQDWMENGENEYIYDTNAVLDSIDAQPTVSRWIPVTERLPEPLVEVLILTQKAIGKSHVSAGQYSRLTGMWYIGGYSTQAKITHWMPLPDAPEEGHREED